jgi:c-di-GMP-binding flagellar brake protein YcgR
MQDKWMGPERRETVRLELSANVDYTLINDIKSAELSRRRRAIVTNISARGLRIESDEIDDSQIEELYNGRIKLGLEMKLPAIDTPIRALAKVAWLTKGWKEQDGRAKYVMGLEFVDITTAHQDLIRGYIIDSYLR